MFLYCRSSRSTHTIKWVVGGGGGSLASVNTLNFVPRYKLFLGLPPTPAPATHTTAPTLLLSHARVCQLLHRYAQNLSLTARNASRCACRVRGFVNTAFIFYLEQWTSQGLPSHHIHLLKHTLTQPICWWSLSLLCVCVPACVCVPWFE